MRGYNSIKEQAWVRVCIRVLYEDQVSNCAKNVGVLNRIAACPPNRTLHEEASNIITWGLQALSSDKSGLNRWREDARPDLACIIDKPCVFRQ